MYQLYTYISQSIFVTINNRVGTYFHQTWLFRCCHLYYLNGVGGLVDRTVAKDHTKQQAIKFRVRKCSKKNFPSPSSCRACCSVPPHLAHHRCLRADCPSRSVRHLISTSPHSPHTHPTASPSPSPPIQEHMEVMCDCVLNLDTVVRLLLCFLRVSGQRVMCICVNVYADIVCVADMSMIVIVCMLIW